MVFVGDYMHNFIQSLFKLNPLLKVPDLILLPEKSLLDVNEETPQNVSITCGK